MGGGALAVLVPLGAYLESGDVNWTAKLGQGMAKVAKRAEYQHVKYGQEPASGRY